MHSVLSSVITTSVLRKRRIRFGRKFVQNPDFDCQSPLSLRHLLGLIYEPKNWHPHATVNYVKLLLMQTGIVFFRSI